MNRFWLTAGIHATGYMYVLCRPFLFVCDLIENIHDTHIALYNKRVDLDATNP